MKEKKSMVNILNYYTNEMIDIPLDPIFTILENSNRYFKKYQKLKSSASYIEEHMEIAKYEIEYFKVIEYQLKDASINDTLEIQAELINGKYLFKNVQKNKKKEEPKLFTYILENGTLITVGKNNVQIEYLTHKMAKPNEMWFHIKDAPGSHVDVHKMGDLTE
jgi:predicted ribosome quality control (RQC) complex YloA/Tae2 family protein